MKYRCLTNKELKELEDDFKTFLIANHVHAEEWEKINKTYPDKAQELVEMFSDIVLDKALKNIKYVEYVNKDNIKSFFCDENEITLIGVTSNSSDVDFTKQKLNEIKPSHLSLFKATKPYAKNRELEIFDLIESGCSIGHKDLYDNLLTAYNKIAE